MKYVFMLLAATSSLAIAAPKAKPRAVKPVNYSVATDSACLVSKLNVEQRDRLIKFFSEEEAKQKEDASAVGSMVRGIMPSCEKSPWSKERKDLAVQAMIVSPSRDAQRAALAAKGLDMTKVDAAFMSLPPAERSAMMGGEADRTRVVEKILAKLETMGVTSDQIEKADATGFGTYLGTFAAYDMAVRGASMGRPRN